VHFDNGFLFEMKTYETGKIFIKNKAPHKFPPPKKEWSLK